MMNSIQLTSCIVFETRYCLRNNTIHAINNVGDIACCVLCIGNTIGKTEEVD
jgi:hypothetical protein